MLKPEGNFLFTLRHINIEHYIQQISRLCHSVNYAVTAQPSPNRRADGRSGCYMEARDWHYCIALIGLLRSSNIYLSGTSTVHYFVGRAKSDPIYPTNRALHVSEWLNMLTMYFKGWGSPVLDGAINRKL